MPQPFCPLRWKFIAFVPLVLSVCLMAQSTPAPDEQPKSGHTVPPVWSAFYNVEQGPLPDTSNWKIAIRGKQIIVRLAPDANWTQYRRVAAGEVRYTGSEMKLKPREIAQLTDLLQTHLEKDLARVKLAPDAHASGELSVDANITDAKTVNGLFNLAQMGADVGRANVTAWVRDEKTKQPVACIQLVESGKRYDQGFDLFRTGEIRLVLRDESHLIAQALNLLSQNTVASH